MVRSNGPKGYSLSVVKKEVVAVLKLEELLFDRGEDLLSIIRSGWF